MTVIEMVNENHAILRRRGKQAEVWLKTEWMWFYTQHSSNRMYFVGRWLSWRLNRARARMIRSEFWTQIPVARALPTSGPVATLEPPR